MRETEFMHEALEGLDIIYCIDIDTTRALLKLTKPGHAARCGPTSRDLPVQKCYFEPLAVRDVGQTLS